MTLSIAPIPEYIHVESDVLGAGKATEAIAKLSQTVLVGFGKPLDIILKSWEIERIAKAKAQEKIILTKSEIESEQLLQRVHFRFQSQEIRRQKNIEDIVSSTLELLPEKVSSDSVSEDWAVRYFNVVSDIGDEELQKIWARILAGEVAQPGSYSLRTLEVLKNLHPEEAKLFEKICHFVINGEEIYLFTGETDSLVDFGVTYENLIVLGETGLLDPRQHSIFYSNVDGEELQSNTIFAAKPKGFNVILKPGEKFDLPVLRLTKAGQEIFKLTDTEINQKFFEKIKTTIREKGFEPL